MKLLNKRTGENSVKKYISLLIILSCIFAAFAQNVKPYTVDLNGIQAFNDDRSVSFDKKTNPISVKKRKFRPERNWCICRSEYLTQCQMESRIMVWILICAVAGVNQAKKKSI